MEEHNGALYNLSNYQQKLTISPLEDMANGEFDAYLPQSSGYAIILGGGSGFALFMQYRAKE